MSCIISYMAVNTGQFEMSDMGLYWQILRTTWIEDVINNEIVIEMLLAISKSSDI